MSEDLTNAVPTPSLSNLQGAALQGMLDKSLADIAREQGKLDTINTIYKAFCASNAKRIDVDELRDFLMTLAAKRGV